MGFMQIQSFAQLAFFVLFLFASLGQAIAQEDIKKFIEKMNLQKQWDELVPYVRTKMTEKLSLMKDSTREKDNLQRTLNAPYFTEGVLYRLVTGGYTKEYIENLTRIGLPVLDIMYSLVGDARNRSILTANLIVIAKIDTCYNDESFCDGLRSTCRVSVIENLKGDSTIQNFVLRNAGWVMNGLVAGNGCSHCLEFVPKMNHFYLLLLSKIAYEEMLFSPMLITIGGHTPKLEFNDKLNFMRKDCFVGKFTSLDLGETMIDIEQLLTKVKAGAMIREIKKYRYDFPISPIMKNR